MDRGRMEIGRDFANDPSIDDPDSCRSPMTGWGRLAAVAQARQPSVIDVPSLWEPTRQHAIAQTAHPQAPYLLQSQQNRAY